MTDPLSLLKPNTIIRGPMFPEPVQVLVVVPMGTAVKLIGKGLRTGQVHEPILSLDKIAGLEISRRLERIEQETLFVLHLIPR